MLEPARSGPVPPRAARGRVAAVERFRLGDGRALCVRRWRGDEDAAFVFLHGLLDSSQGWTRVAEELSGSCAAFDLPGFGYSDCALRGSIAAYAADIAEGLARIGARRFTLVGHSLGGAVATSLAELIPDDVAALVLLAPAGFGHIRLAEAISVPGVREVVQAALPFVLSNRAAVTAGYLTMVANGRLPERAVIDRVTRRGRQLVDGAREATRAVVEAGRSENAFHLRRVGYAGPVVAVWGDHDRLVPLSHRNGVQAALPQAEVHVWPGMGHHHPAERFDDLLTLLQRVAAGGVQPAPELGLADSG